ncbi:AAA family ATPase [Deinococcus yavapaiensis]|uniref:Tetratricopeptide repeat protein n=1 Tax=Deinococcus yavapaiensis KR-236 TaxID=694435 RepID=A0A318S847_9DEIO|nr:AAA family ATPase [Deinococcus yavapaiensis]PYE53908.1 tetratricopeptide repeat protein [Deinococcus yavapaiensis KR-236]
MNPQLADLAVRMRALTARRSGLAVGLWGEPGIGKTHAARNLLLGTPCRSLSVPAATSPAELARSLHRPARLPAWVRRVLERLEAGEELENARAVDTLGAALAALSPFVLHLEDLHEADSGGQRRVASLASLIRRARGVGLLVTSRVPPPEELEPLRLWPLDRPESDALLEAEAASALPAEARAWLFGHAAGNPLFTLEYFRLLARQGHLWNDGHRWHWRAPQGDPTPVMVEALIEQAVLNASALPTLAEVIACRALLPVGADRALLVVLTGLTQEALTEAERELERQAVFSGGEFTHPLYRETALRTLLPQRRRRLARRALAAFGHDLPAASRFVEAAELDSEAAQDWLLRAADQRGAAGDEVGAARLWARSLRYATPEVAARRALAAASRLKEVDVPEATRLAEQAVQAPRQRSEALWLLSELLAAQGRGTLAEQRLMQLPSGEREGNAFWARVLTLRAQNNGRLLELLDEHPGVLAHADPSTACQVGRSLAYCGRATEAEAVARHLLARPGDDPGARIMGLKVLSVVAQVRADFTAMERLEREVLDLVRPTGNLRLIDAALFNRAMALGTLGRYREQTACLEEALKVCQDLGDPTASAIAQVALGSALSEAGEYQQAETLLQDARSFLESLDVSGYLVDCECALSALYQAWQPPHGRVLATRYARAALSHAQEFNDSRSLAESLPVAALAESWAGQPTSALALADQADALANQLDMPQMSRAAHAARGVALIALGRPDEGAEALRAAERLARDMGDLLAAHRTGLQLDRLHGDLASARKRLTWFERRGLGAGADLARRLFPDLKPTPERGAPRSKESIHGHPAQESLPAPLRLEALGTLRCGVAGQPRLVRGHKRRELLACLLEARLAGRSEVTRLGLLDLLYPSHDEQLASAALRDMVHHLRAECGPHLILTTPGGYALGQVSSDAEDFLRTGDTRLWRGVYLASEGADHGDDTVRSALCLALGERAEALLTSDPAEAARLGRLLLAADPYDHTALGVTLNALRALHNHRGLTQTYGQARARLLEVGERLPEHWADYLAVRSGGTP